MKIVDSRPLIHFIHYHRSLSVIAQNRSINVWLKVKFKTKFSFDVSKGRFQSQKFFDDLSVKNRKKCQSKMKIFGNFVFELSLCDLISSVSGRWFNLSTWKLNALKMSCKNINCEVSVEKVCMEIGLQCEWCKEFSIT